MFKHPYTEWRNHVRNEFEHVSLFKESKNVIDERIFISSDVHANLCYIEIVIYYRQFHFGCHASVHLLKILLLSIRTAIFIMQEQNHLGTLEKTRMPWKRFESYC